MEKYWTLSTNLSYKKNTYISFYGGEPLLNVKLIKSIVQWVRSRKIVNCDLIFTMTTNGVLLKKYINFLVENNFKLLVSLDGNDFNNSYRVNHKGENSFRLVYENILYVKNKYPAFYQNNMNFNSVLHNRNDVAELLDFFKISLKKTKKISELNPMGIRKEKLEEFSLLYNNKRNNIERSPNRINLQENLFMDDPAVSELCTFLHWHSGNVYKTYTDLLLDESKKKWLPTGTCLPFQKKIFITTSGKILPCERVSHEYSLGYVTDKEVVLDFEEIVRKYNEYYRKYISQCSLCYNNHTCKQCMFYITGKASKDKSFSNGSKYAHARPDTVELFFKWLKQHLKIKKFWGTTENAVRIQIYAAICTYCLVAIVQHDMQLDRSTYEVLHVLSISLTDKTSLRDLFNKTKFQNDKDRFGLNEPSLFNFNSSQF